MAREEERLLLAAGLIEPGGGGRYKSSFAKADGGCGTFAADYSALYAAVSRFVAPISKPSAEGFVVDRSGSVTRICDNPPIIESKVCNVHPTSGS